LVHLQQFEGPLSLLLYLIRKEEMDIFDINIYDITKQYLDYIQLMRELDLEVAGDFVAMAATLIHIKSRMLLPQYNELGEEVEVEDPRKELVQKLLDYQKFKEAAEKLYERPLLGRDVWRRGFCEDISVEDDSVIVEDSGLFSLISAYRMALRNMRKGTHHVVSKMQSIASRIMDIKDRLIQGTRVRMFDLITPDPQQRRFQLLMTFLALLELGKMGYTSLFQSENYGDIFIETSRPVERDVILRVEEYDSGRAAEIADQLMAESEELTTTEMKDETLLATLDQEPVEEEMIEASDAATDEEILAAEMELRDHEPEANA
jgi:segregation and condensation protein A